MERPRSSLRISVGPATLARDVGPPLVLAALLSISFRWHAVAGVHPGGLSFFLPALAALSLGVRRPWPNAAYIASVVLTALYLALGNRPGPILIAPLFGMLHLMAHRHLRQALPYAIVGGAVIGLAHLRTSSLDAVAIFLAIWVGVGGLFAAVQAVRRAFEAETRAGQEWAERSREEEARRRMAEQRLSMAREVHDIVGHSLAVISLQAGVAEHLLETRPNQARTAVSAIREASRQALTELRGELATLRGEDTGTVSRRPAPGLRDIPNLVASMRAAGLDVRLELSEQDFEVPESVGAAAYRIIQESLTNVVRHAGAGAVAGVRVRAVGGKLLMEIVDSGTGAPEGSAGSGLAGMRERALALGGTLEAVNLPGGGFRVLVSVPIGPRDGRTS